MTAPVIVEPPRTSMEKGTPRRTLTITQDHHEPRETARADPLVRARSASPSLADPTAKGLEGSASSDIGTVVSKAKRAASSLWILIHAQVSASNTTNEWNQEMYDSKRLCGINFLRVNLHCVGPMTEL